MDYLDFHVEVRSRDGAYDVYARSEAGSAEGRVTFPFDEATLRERLDQFALALEQSRLTTRRATPEQLAAQAFGEELYAALFTAPVDKKLEVLLDRASRGDRGVRIFLEIRVPELAALPWEFMRRPGAGAFLAQSERTPIVRWPPTDAPIHPIDVKPPLRILALGSDAPELDIENERQKMDEALARLVREELVEVRWVEPGTIRGLEDALDNGSWHIFHFIGHGRFDERRGEGVVTFAHDPDDPDAEPDLSAEDLALLLGDHPRLELVVLNSCETSASDHLDVFSSTAATLIRAELPAVVAMQYEVTDLAAIAFARAFYGAIAKQKSLEAAVTDARQAMKRISRLEWGTPTLYSRSPDSVLFKLALPAPAEPVPPPAPAPLPVAVQPAPSPQPAAPQPPPAESPPADSPQPTPRRSSLGKWLLGGALGIGLLVAVAALADEATFPPQPTPLPIPSTRETDSTPVTPVEFVTVVDDSGTIRVDVPADWAEVETTARFDELGLTPEIIAAEDYEEFLLNYSVSGLYFAALPLAPDQVLVPPQAIDLLLEGAYRDLCSFAEQVQYEDFAFFGTGYRYTDCEGIGTELFLWEVQAGGRQDHVLVLAVQLTAGSDPAVVERIFNSFGYAQ